MNKEVYRHVLNTYGRNPGQWFGLLAEIVRTLISRVYVTILMAQVAANIASGDADSAKRHIIYFLIAYVAGAIIGAIGELVAVRTENDVYGRLMMVYYLKLTGKDMSFYRDSQTGYLTSTFRQYLDGAILFVRFLRGEVTRVTISLIVPALVLLVVDWKIGIVACLIVITQVLYVVWSSSKANEYRQMSHEIYRKVTSEVSDEITNIVAFKSAGKEKEAHSRFAHLISKEVKTFWLRRRTTTLLDLPRNLITAIGVTTAFYFVVLGNFDKSKSVGLIVLTLTYMFQIIRNVSELPTLITQHDDFVTKIYPTLKYLNNENEEIKDPSQPKSLNVSKGTIDIGGVTFSYPSNSGKGQRIKVFNGLSLRVSAGEQVGIVGLSGAGKTTLANLLMRFDDIEGGSIKIDGVDIRNVAQAELRQKIAYVPQEPLLFHRTIRENIAYFDSEATDRNIKNAAEAAHAQEFIEKLPEGYNTIVGERGIKLSGGQKQRVVIARAILKGAPIMIFDEATSALDSESEKIIQHAMPEIIGKQTAIVIAHRLSTVAGLDRIVVMHEGKITEEGNHEELLNIKGKYYSLWQKQISNKQD